MGISNILCLSGDHQTFGSQPDALNVHDIDSMNLIRTVFTMREEGQDMRGFDLKMPPRMYIGAAANPFADPFEFRVILKASAGFILWPLSGRKWWEKSLNLQASCPDLNDLFYSIGLKFSSKSV